MIGAPHGTERPHADNGRPRLVALRAVPICLGLTALVLATKALSLCIQRASVTLSFAPAVGLQLMKEICDAARELARFLAPFSGLLPNLSVAGDEPHETHSLATGVATDGRERGRGRAARTRARPRGC